MANAPAMIAATPATTPMAIFLPDERPWEGVGAGDCVGVRLEVAEGILEVVPLEELAAVDKAVEDFEVVELVDEAVEELEVVEVVELVAAAVAVSCGRDAGGSFPLPP